jgi:hypothetical protein
MIFAAMTNAEWISLGSAAISLITLGLNIFLAIRSAGSSRKASEEARRVADQAHMLQQQSLLLAMGASETEFMDKLNAARQRAEELLAELQPLAAKSKPTAEEKRLLRGKAATYKSVVEGYFNLLEVGCQRCLEGKCDKEAFKKTYRKDVRTFVEQRDNKAIYDLLHPRDISHYKAIWDCYAEWEKS